MNSNLNIINSMEHMGKLIADGWKIYDDYMFKYENGKLQLVNYILDEKTTVDMDVMKVKIENLNDLFEN